MTRALELAWRGLFTTDPNPRVGCVVVRDGEVVGEGFHERAGEPHAEVLALRAAGGKAVGATAYVTLEPCAHLGRTPPCTDALIAARVARVVAAIPDPNPLVVGKGMANLMRAGIKAEIGICEAEATALNAGFIARMTRGRPLVRVKVAASLDGRTALASGESKWITGDAARLDVQRLRARSSAILTGIGTVRADDPSLTVRAFDIGRQPLRVVVDSGLAMSPHARMISLPGRTLVAGARAPATQHLRQAGVELIFAPGDDGRVDLGALMTELARREVNEVLVEAGATLNGALLAAGLVDELVIYLAPHLMGSAERAMFAIGPLARMNDRVALTISDIRRVGDDWRVTATVRN
jgi:diaminohydroxyphosphoribosylaminopyrimidine deaminase/5-amino-6-(5-phosphoribosylamino)uracil reductase